MADHDAFRVMCDMWGVETAVEKAKEIGIKVSQEEIDAQKKTQQQKFQNALRALGTLRNEEKEKKDEAL